MVTASWTDNAIMFWQDTDASYKKVTDHGRASLQESTERIENKTRMADGTLRRYFVTKKRTWNTSWENLPSTNTKVGGFTTADGGMAGEDIEDFINRNNDAFRLVLRRGSAKGKTMPVKTDAQLPFADTDFVIVKVMVADFSKEIVKRGIVDLWSCDISLEEV